VGGPPAQWRAELWLEDPGDLTINRKAIEPGLAEDLLSIEKNLESTPGAALELDCVQHRRPAVEDLSGQAHGLVEVISRNAELDRDLGFGAGHLGALTSSYTFGRGAIPR
jgi:hypothetical protein